MWSHVELYITSPKHLWPDLALAQRQPPIYSTKGFRPGIYSMIGISRTFSDRWGHPLPQYFEDGFFKVDDELGEPLEILDPRELLSYTDFEDIISISDLKKISRLALTPAYLRSFRGAGIVPRLMRSLRVYCEDNKVSRLKSSTSCSFPITSL
jgi:hypothetical protein